MSKKEIFEERYQAGNTPWELDRFDSSRELPAKCWLCLMKKRSG